ncbi:MAG: zinc-binding alcohol dehydrogenase [Bacteroidota bacterium]
MPEARALWHQSASTSVIKEAPINLPEGDGFCEVKAIHSLISTGTERIVARGFVPIEMNESMRVPYMEGSFQLPIKYGYSMVGEVITEGHPFKGRLVHMIHPHQDLCVVRNEDITLVPEMVPPKRATLASNLETALTAIWDAQVSVGDKVLLVGFGMIGSLVGRLIARLPAVKLKVIDTDPARIQLANKLGFNAGIMVDEDEIFDCAFHASGSGEGLQYCIDKVGFEGKVIEMSWYGSMEIDLNLGGTFHSQRKQIISSQVSTLPAGRRANWDVLRRKETVFRLLEDPALDHHITDTIPFDRLPAFFKKLRGHSPGSKLAYCVEY